jgi:uncharacterized protein with PIN domain
LGEASLEMSSATFRFYAELNDFLPAAKQQTAFDYFFSQNPSAKDAIEACGIPHTEVDLILANGDSVDFAYQVQNRDYLSVYPVFESLDIAPILKIRPQPLREIRFVLDIHLGKLATCLRLLGFDALYSNRYSDPELAEISHSEGRILLTRDRGLLKRNRVTHGYCLRNLQPKSQVCEVLQRFDLYRLSSPFSRCLRCNGLVRPVDKGEVVSLLPPRIRLEFDTFFQCARCGQTYWEGSHYKQMAARVSQWLKRDSTSADA